MDIATVRLTELEDLFQKIDKIEEFINSHSATESLFGKKWKPKKVVCEMLDLDDKTFRKYKRVYGWNTAKIGSKTYIDIDSVQKSMESNSSGDND